MILYFSSEGVPRPDSLKELLGISSTSPKVALINNAQDPYPENIAKERGAALTTLFQSFGFQTLSIDLRKYDNKTDQLTDELRTCQLIWCSGGNAFWLRYVMKTSGFDQIIKPLLAEGIVYGGWSAGVVVTGPSLQPIELMDDQNKAPEIIRDGLGLVDFFVWPHWDKEKYLPLQKEASIRMKRLPYKSVTLRDGEALIVENDQVRLIKLVPTSSQSLSNSMNVKNSKQIILLDGAKGAGKSTASHLLVAHLPQAVFLSLDIERRALPDQEKTRSELNQQAFEIILEKTKTGLESGKSIVIDCGLTEERVSIFESLAIEGKAKIHKFFLKASYDTLLERVRGRDRVKGKPTDEKRFEEVFNILHSKDFTGFTIIETSTLTPQEITDEIVNLLP